jgi:hypothetical protein
MDFTADTPKIRNRLLLFWLTLYGLVGSQLVWTLRPFFGHPDHPFQLFREVEGNFYSQVIRSLFPCCLAASTGRQEFCDVQR